MALETVLFELGLRCRRTHANLHDEDNVCIVQFGCCFSIHFTRHSNFQVTLLLAQTHTPHNGSNGINGF